MHTSFSYKILAAFIVVLLLVSCSDKSELTRTKAAELIETSQDESLNKIRQFVQLHDEGSNIGVGLGWWSRSHEPQKPLSGSIAGEITDHKFSYVNYVTLRIPAALSVEVTGIMGDSDAPTKTADFIWSYKDLPPSTRLIARKGGTGKAIFKLYDDGWRLSSVNISQSKEPFPITEADRDKMAAEVRARFAQRMEAAMTSTKVLQQHTLNAKSATWGNSKVDLTITDVGIEVTERTRAGAKTKQLLFAQMRRNQTPAGYNKNNYLYIGGSLISVDRPAKGSTAYTAVITEVNSAFNDWREKFSDIVTYCETRARSQTWGCRIS